MLDMFFLLTMFVSILIKNYFDSSHQKRDKLSNNFIKILNEILIKISKSKETRIFYINFDIN